MTGYDHSIMTIYKDFIFKLATKVRFQKKVTFLLLFRFTELFAIISNKVAMATVNLNVIATLLSLTVVLGNNGNARFVPV